MLFHFFVNFFSQHPKASSLFPACFSSPFYKRKTMPSSAADLEALKAKLADAVKTPLTYAQLVPLQASLDAADAARYHDDGSLPETDNVALIDECYGMWGTCSGTRGGRKRRGGGAERCGREERDGKKIDDVVVAAIIALFCFAFLAFSPLSAPGIGPPPAPYRPARHVPCSRGAGGKKKGAERADKAREDGVHRLERGRRWEEKATAQKLPFFFFFGLLSFFLNPPHQKKKKKKLNKQTDLLASALDHATDVDARVRPIISNLKGIKKALDRLSHAKAASTEEVQHYQQMLAAIDAKRSDGVFGGTLADVPAGQAQAVELLEQAFERAHALLEGATDMDSHLKAEVFEPLVKHKRRE